MLLTWPGIQLDEVDSFGKTALHYAAENAGKLGSTKLVRALMIAGACPSILDQDGRKPIYYTELYEDKKFAKEI